MSYIYMSNVLNMKTSKKTSTSSIFTVDLGEGNKMAMEPEIPYGTFIKEAQKVKNYQDLNHIIGKNGFSMKSVKPLVAYLDLPTEKVATPMGVSSRTLSRWDNDSLIGAMASRTLLEIDRLSKKGLAIFGSSDLFKLWLRQSNTALGDVAPIELLTEPYGVELVEDALEAMEFGSIL